MSWTSHRAVLAALVMDLAVAAASGGVAWAGTSEKQSTAELSAVCRTGQAPGGRPPVCMDLFYEVLADYGTWIETDRYGTLFCPHPEKFAPDFRPFAKGHWVMTEAGWAFVGDHPTSWVTDHYGRWVEAGLHGCSWGWVPGEVWSPAWVDFHVGENIIAWRPAPYDGVPVQLRAPPGARLQYVRIGGEAAPLSEQAFVAVPDRDFAAPQVQEVALSGPALYAALRDTVILPDARAGLHSRERFEVVAQMQESRGLREPGGEPGLSGQALRGEPPEPASRVSHKGDGGKGRGRAQVAGAAGTVRTGPPGKSEGGQRVPRPGQTPPGAGKVYWSGDQNQGSFSQPGQGGVKVLEWDKAKQQPATPPAK